MSKKNIAIDSNFEAYRDYAKFYNSTMKLLKLTDAETFLINTLIDRAIEYKLKLNRQNERGQVTDGTNNDK